MITPKINNQKPMKKQPLLIMLACFIFGIIYFEKFSFTENFNFISLIVSVLLVLCSFLKIEFFQKYKNFFLGFFFFAIGNLAHFLHSKTEKFPVFPSKPIVVFSLNKKLNSNEKNKRYEVTVLKVEDIMSKPFQVVLSIPKEEKELDYRHFYKAEIYLNKVEKPSQDFGFNYQKYLARKDIYFQGFVPNSYQVAEKNSLTFSEKTKQKRLEVLQNINKANLSEKSREFTKGIILADRTEMDSETVQDFSKSGLVHILAISGSHMAIIFWLVLFILKPVFPPKFRNFPIVISLIFIWFFAIFIDFGSSVIRSCIMISAYYVYVLLQRKPDLLHSMAIAGFVILIFDTNQLFDLGFQLSFLAVFGIFWLNEPILEYLPRPKNKVQNFFVNVVSISVSAQIATLPLVIFYFHQYSLISILANLVVIPISEVIIIFSLLMVILFGFSAQISWLNLIYNFCVDSLLKLIHFFASIDFAFFKNIPMNGLEVVLLFCAIYFLRKILLHQNQNALAKFSFFILLFFFVRIGFNIYQYNKSEVLVHYYFKEKIFSVKEKDKVVFWLKENSQQEKITKTVIEPYLVSKRTKNVEVKNLPKITKYVMLNGKTYHLK